MRDDLDPGIPGSNDVDLDRREVLASLAKYSATVAGAATVVLTASASVSMASVSGGGGGQNPGNSKPVGKAPYNGTRGQVPSGKIK